MDSSAFNHIGGAVRIGVRCLLLSVPLAIWKLVDIAIWLFGHVNISFG